LKRLAVIVLLMGTLTVLAACASIEDINAVVNNFWDQWKAGNAAGMVDLMTDEVDYGMLYPDDALAGSLAASLAKLPVNRSIPAETLAAALASSSLPNSGTFSISSTEAFGEYAIVTCQLFITTAEPIKILQFIFHLNDTDAGWKINFLGIKGAYPKVK